MVAGALAELHRNPPRCRLIGIASEDQIPYPWNLSRFLDTLGQEPYLQALRALFDSLARRLGAVVPDLGRDTAGDSTALAARAKLDPKAVRAESAQGLPQPTGGRKEYTDEQGRVGVVERVSGRLRVFWGADDGNSTGARRFHAFVGAVLVVHRAFATLLARAPRWEGTLGRTRLGLIAEALAEPVPA